MKERDSTPPATLPEAPAATEGVIQFRYTLRAPGAADRIGSTVLATLEACRATLRNAGLIGRDANRYGGFAFGNVSARDAHDPGRFFITASQMTDAPTLDARHWPRIDAFDAITFHAAVTGDFAPSSESVTHAVIYKAAAAIGCVLHVHCSEVWRAGQALGLAATGVDTPYGSLQLAAEVEALLTRYCGALVFTLPGHEDGVFACAADVTGATELLMSTVERARAYAKKRARKGTR